MILSTPARKLILEKPVEHFPNFPHLCHDRTSLELCKAKTMLCYKTFICRSLVHCKIKPLFRLDNSQASAHGTRQCVTVTKKDVCPCPHSPVTEGSLFLRAHRKLSASPCSWVPHQTLQDICYHCNLKGAGCPVRKYIQSVQKGENAELATATLC